MWLIPLKRNLVISSKRGGGSSRATHHLSKATTCKHINMLSNLSKRKK